MSSILRALKKLDEDTLPREPGPGGNKIKIGRMVHRETGTQKIFTRLLFAASLVILLGTAVWIIIHSTQKPAVDPGPVDPGQKQETGVQPVQPTTERRETVEKPAVPAVAGEASREAIAIDPPQLDYSAQITTKAPPTPSLDKSPSPTGNIPQKTVQETGTPTFILKGILWSDTPARRIAMIDGHYLKEGDSLQGVTILRIEPNAVILKSGDRQWTLKVTR